MAQSQQWIQSLNLSQLFRCSYRGPTVQKQRRLSLSWLGLIAMMILAAGWVSPRTVTRPASPAALASARKARVVSVLSSLSFERNEGQTDKRVRFLARGAGYTVFLTSNEAVLALQKVSPATRGGLGEEGRESVLRLKLEGARAGVEVRGEEELEGKSNYFIGRDPEGWHAEVPTYGRVEYEGIYRGIDVVYYGHQGELEYDFKVKRGAEVGEVGLKVEGAERVRLDKGGEVVLETKAGEVRLKRPEAYQEERGKRRRVGVKYVWRGKGEIGLVAWGYRRSEPLVIDPVLSYSTYLGGSGGDIAYGIAVDSSGDAYVTGETASVNFPVSSAAQTTLKGNGDAFIAKLNPTGSGLIYSTYVGGSGTDSGAGIAIDASGDAYVVGTTSSTDFPVTSSAFQSTYAGTESNAFVVKLSPAGSSIVYASYLGGSVADFGQAIAVDASGNAYVTGSTQSPNFPTVSPIQIGDDSCSTNAATGIETCTSDAFVSKVNPTGTALVYSTYLGGSGADTGQAVAVDSQGDCYVDGYTTSSDFPTQNALQSALTGTEDAFVTEVNPEGSALVFSTYLGGGTITQAFGLALDSVGSLYVAGETQSVDFPVTSNVFQASYAGNGDAFVTKLSPGAASIVYSTYIGGSQADQANAIAVDASGNVVVVGYTQSSDFPTVDPMQTILGISGAGNCSGSVCADAFIVRLGPSGSALYSTFLGGSAADYAQAVALDSSGIPYVAGSTESSNFPVISGALEGTYMGQGTSGNAFIVKINPADAPGVALTPQTVNFGNQTVNETSPAQTLTLINEGSAPLSITQIAGTQEFGETNDCGTTVTAGGGTCTINLTFTPQTPGSSTDQVTITDNAAGSPQTIAVTGNGITGGAGTLTITPSSITFPTQTIGTTSAGQVVQILNGSQTSVTVTAISISGDFTETNNCGATPFVLNSGAGCSATIFFAPTSGGSLTGSFSVTSNASGSPSVSLSGSGAAAFSLSSNSRENTVVVGTTSTTFTITASAANNFTSSISLSCSSSSSSSSATCSANPSSITPGQSSTLKVSSLSASSANPTNITVTGTSGTQTVTLPLSVFFSDFSLSISPSLGTVTAGDSTSYTVTATPLNGFNQVVLLSCSAGLPANATCTWPTGGVTLNGTSTATATFTVTTTSQIQSSRFFIWPTGSRPLFPRAPWIAGAGLLLLLAGFLASRRKLLMAGRLRFYWVFAVLGIFLLVMSGVSCNENYGFIGSNPAPVGTPTGVYTLTITGTLGSNSAVTRATTTNLAVNPSP